MSCLNYATFDFCVLLQDKMMLLCKIYDVLCRGNPISKITLAVKWQHGKCQTVRAGMETGGDSWEFDVESQNRELGIYTSS